jgi:hypothetical protein
MLSHPPFLEMAAPQCGQGRQSAIPSMVSGQNVFFNQLQTCCDHGYARTEQSPEWN